MATKWSSFTYRARFGDPALEFAERSAVTAPEALCQTERHMMTTQPAAYLEIMFSDTDPSLTVHRAWFTCAGCHNQLVDEYDPSIN